MRHLSSRLSLAIACAVVSGCVSDSKPTVSRKVAALSEQPALELGETWSRENDDEAAQILDATENMLKAHAEKDTVTRRDAHPKHHGCTKAFFDIDAKNLAAEQQVGIFAPGAQKEYQAWVRFSNGEPTGATASDLNSDVRGMAIKLMNVPETQTGSHDLVMCTAPEFFSKDSADYLELHQALTRSQTSVLWYLATHPTNALRIYAARVKIASPLEAPYYSAVPYKMGNRSMRFSVEPCEKHAELPQDDSDPNFLRTRLVQTLQTGERCFRFFVQPNMNPGRQLVEDPRIVWNKKTSPRIQVATLRIPAQSGIDSKEQMNLCENLSFDPWHSQAALRPLGQINRVRSLVYRSISEFRHHENHVTAAEPRDHDPCRGSAASLCEEPRR